MTMDRAGRVRGAVAIAAGLLVSGVLVTAPAPAFAHNFLLASTPEEGSTVTELPEQFSVTTNEPMLDVSGEAAGFALQVRDETGSYYGDGCLSVDGSTLSTPAALGEAGTYTVGWRVVSADGHTVDGEYAFTWQPPADHDPAPAADAVPSCGDTGSTDGAPTPTESEAAPDEAGAVNGTDLLWVLGTVVVVGAVLVGTLLLLTRRRAPKPTDR